MLLKGEGGRGGERKINLFTAPLSRGWLAGSLCTKLASKGRRG